MRSLGKISVIGLSLIPLVFSGISAGQGLETKASKDDWEEINFEFNSAVLTDGFPSMLRLGELLNQHGDYKVKLTGHTDSVGSDRYNDRLAQKRVEAVKAFLEKYGAKPNQILTEGEGKRRPRVDNRTKEGRFMNRRVEMVLTDGQGKIIGAGGIGDAIKALQALQAQQAEQAKAQATCCNEILNKLDKLDEIARMLRDMKEENAGLKKEIDGLKAAQSDLKQQVAGLPKPLTEPQTAAIAEKSSMEAIEKTREKRFSLLGANVGADDQGRVTFTGKGRYFAPLKDGFALQAQAEYMYYRDKQEGQFDIGLVDRWKNMQVGLFSSFKNVNFRNVKDSNAVQTFLLGNPPTSVVGGNALSGNGTLAQGAVTLDYLFSRGKVGLFGTKGFLDQAVIQSAVLSRTITLETYLKVVDQVGASTSIGLYKNNYLEGNIGYLKSQGGADRPGGTLRFVFPLNEKWAFTLEGGMNETYLGKNNNGRVVAGIQFGSFLRPKEFLGNKGPVPVDVPRVRYEVLTRRIRTGYEPPVADAGADQIGIDAGLVTLDGSKSYDPEGGALTYQWTQTGGQAVSLAGVNTAKATFTAAEGQSYTFRLMVTNPQGLSAVARVNVTTARAPQVRIVRFTASPSNIQAGQASTLSWQVDSADTVTIDGIGTVDARAGTTSVSPAVTTTYKLTAKNRTSEVSETVTVTVQRPDVRIVFFSATPANVTAGQSTTLTWQTENADTVEISGIGAVAKSGNTVVMPTTQTTYVMTARNSFGSTTAQVTIQVMALPMPRIVRFSAAPLEILQGESSALVWQVENATEVTISNGVGTVAQSGNVNVTPNDTTTYVLTARNSSGDATAQATITVIPPVRIISFVATPATSPSPGSPVTLTWATANATDVSIDGIGVVQGNGSVTVRPTVDTTYTIRAYGRRSQTQATATVKVNTATNPGGGGPIANAGPDQVTTQREVQLDGSKSVNPDGGLLGFSWRAVGRQPELILGGDTATPTVRFAPLAFGEYVFELTVTDSKGRYAKSTTKVFFGAY